MPDLSKFISEFKHGFQQGNRFLVQIFVQPSMVGQIIADATPRGGNVLQTIVGAAGLVDTVLAVPQVVTWLATGMLAESASIPSRGYTQVEQSMYGITERFPVHAEFIDLSVSFLMPHTTNIPFVDNGVPRFFNMWLNQIQNLANGPDSGFDFRFPSSYYSTILLTLLDKKDNGTISYEFHNAYPTTVKSAELSWSEAEFIKLPVDFTYSYWKVVPHLESAILSTVDTIVNKIL